MGSESQSNVSVTTGGERMKSAATVAENDRGTASKPGSFVGGDKMKSVAVTAVMGKSEAAGSNRTELADDTTAVVNSAMTSNLALRTSGNRTEFMTVMFMAGNSTLAASDGRMTIDNSAFSCDATGESSTAASSDITGVKMTLVIAKASPLASPSSPMSPSLLADTAVNKTTCDSTHLSFHEDL